MSSERSEGASFQTATGATAERPRGVSTEAVLLEILKVRMAEPGAWLSQLITASALYSVAVVALLKVALDAAPCTPLRNGLCSIGIVGSLSGLFGCYLMTKLRQTNIAAQVDLLRMLGVSYRSDELNALKYATLSAVIGLLVTIAVWLWMLITQPSSKL